LLLLHKDIILQQQKQQKSEIIVTFLVGLDFNLKFLFQCVFIIYCEEYETLILYLFYTGHKNIIFTVIFCMISKVERESRIFFSFV
jgi:hypothetical protein